MASVKFSRSLKTIGDCCFTNCPLLTKVDLLNSRDLKSIGEQIFRSCSSLRSINFPRNLTSIGNTAFGYCSSLTSVTFPSSLSTIGEYAFDDCLNLSSITWDAWNGNTTLQHSSFSSVCPDGGTVTVTNPDGYNSAALFEYLKQNGGLPESWHI